MDDCGGGYSESIAEMCEELQNGLTPLLIVTPNGRDESGANRDCFLLNPAAKSLLHMNMFRFLGNFLLTCYLNYTIRILGLREIIIKILYLNLQVYFWALLSGLAAL